MKQSTVSPSSFEKIDRALTQRALEAITRAPIHIRLLHEKKLWLSGDVKKKIAEINDLIRQQCTHGLILEIPRRRVESTPRGLKILPPTRVCLICGTYENAIQKRDRLGNLQVTFLRLTAKPIAVVRNNFGAITVGLTSSNRPLIDFVKATLASRLPNGTELIDKIMFPNSHR